MKSCNGVSLDLSLLHAEQPQLSQPISIGEVLQPPGDKLPTTQAHSVLRRAVGGTGPDTSTSTALLSPGLTAQINTAPGMRQRWGEASDGIAQDGHSLLTPSTLLVVLRAPSRPPEQGHGRTPSSGVSNSLRVAQGLASVFSTGIRKMMEKWK